MVDVFVHLGRNSYVDINDVGHFHPFFFCCMGKVGKGLIDANQVFGSVATLSWSLLALSEVGLIFNKIGLKGRPGFLIDCSPRPTIFLILFGIIDHPVHYADKLGLSDWLALFHCKVCALLESLDKTLNWFFRVISRLEALVNFRHFRDIDTGVVGIKVHEDGEG